MSKKKRNTQQTQEQPAGQDEVAAGLAEAINTLPSVHVRWGYGFEPVPGAKWRAYKLAGLGVVFLGPERGERLDQAVTRIRTALAQEVGQAQRNRRSA